VQYIADQKPEAALVPPAASFERYKLQEWLNFITSELHKSFSPLFSPATPEECKALAKESLAKRFDWLDKHLATTQYLHGGKFSVADVYAFVVIGWAKPMKFDLERWPNLKTWHERIAARPKVQEALKAEATG
jgi:glutathione S-transferase